MNRKDAAPQIFQEAAEYYLAKGQTGVAITILRTGAELTGSPDLTELYEANRYRFTRTSPYLVNTVSTTPMYKNGTSGMASLGPTFFKRTF